jgi:hypothetical protein
MAFKLLLETTDIGATNATSLYLDLSEAGAATFVIYLGSTATTPIDWHASDILDTCKLRQATTAAGGSVKDITSAEIDTDLTTAGDYGWLTVRANALDIANGFKFVCCYVAEGGNSGTDKVTIFGMTHDLHYHHKAATSSVYKIVG